MRYQIFNLFLDNIDQFNVLGYQFEKIHPYVPSRKEDRERTGEHVHTFTAIYDGDEKRSIFYDDVTQLYDIVILIRFFVGDYVCTVTDCEISWSKYGTPGSLDNRRSFVKRIVPKIINILLKLSREDIKKNKLDTVLFLCDEYYKTSIFDVKLALLGPITNVFCDIYEKKYAIPGIDKDKLEVLCVLRERLRNDTNYSIEERSQITLALTNYIDRTAVSLTEKTRNFIKNNPILIGLEEYYDEDKINRVAQQLNSLRNGMLHAGVIDSDSIEKRFKGAKLDTDKDTFDAKVRVSIFTEILITNALLELLGVNDYYYKNQDIEAIKEYFTKGTIRDN